MKSYRTRTTWNGVPVFKDDENNEFIKIGQYSVDIKYNGVPRPEEDIQKEIQAVRKYAFPWKK